MTREQIFSIIENADEREQMNAWNNYCEETNSFDDMVYNNDEETYEMMFDSMDSALRAAHYGNYTYTDEYCCLNGYGNLDTFSHLDDDNCPIDLDTLADWFEEHEDDLEDWFDFDPDDYKDDDDGDDDDDDDFEIICPRCGERLEQGDYEYDAKSGHVIVTTCPNCFCSGLQVEIRDLDESDDETETDGDDK